jgi:hypothetical protein
MIAMLCGAQEDIVRYKNEHPGCPLREPLVQQRLPGLGKRKVKNKSEQDYISFKLQQMKTRRKVK